VALCIREGNAQGSKPSQYKGLAELELRPLHIVKMVWNQGSFFQNMESFEEMKCSSTKWGNKFSLALKRNNYTL
jgi:hypothetical protein